MFLVVLGMVRFGLVRQGSSGAAGFDRGTVRCSLVGWGSQGCARVWLGKAGQHWSGKVRLGSVRYGLVW